MKRCGICNLDKCLSRKECKKIAEKAYRSTIRGCALKLLGRAKATRPDGNELDIDFIVAKLEKGICEATGWPVDLSASPRHFDRPSLDRFDSSKGYTKENTRLVCWGVNNMLGSYGQDKLLEVADAIRAKLAGGSV